MSSQLVPKVDFGNIHKFLVSLGLALVLAALVVPWFILRESDALLVSTQQLNELTQTARETLERKQNSIHFLVIVWPYVSVVLLTSGVSLVVFGLVKWRQRQAVQDRME